MIRAAAAEADIGPRRAEDLAVLIDGPRLAAHVAGQHTEAEVRSVLPEHSVSVACWTRGRFCIADYLACVVDVQRPTVRSTAGQQAEVGHNAVGPSECV